MDLVNYQAHANNNGATGDGLDNELTYLGGVTNEVFPIEGGVNVTSAVEIFFFK